jgi:hypothetical protein
MIADNLKIFKFFDLNLIFYSLIGIIIGLLFLMQDPIILLGAAMFLFCTVYFSLRTKFIILFIAALYPFSMGTVAGKDILLIEAIAPVLFLSIGYHLIKARDAFFPKGARLFLLMLLMFLGCVAYHFIVHPVSAEIFGVSSEYNRGLRIYYTIFISSIVYLSSLWYFSYFYRGNRPWLRLVLLISIAVGLIRLISYFSNVEIPFLAGTFRYSEDSAASVSKVAHRIGGLDTVSLVGFSALLASYHRKKLDVFACTCFLLLAGLTIAGGGRMQLFGLFLSFVVYFLLINRKRAIILVPIIVATVLTANFALKSINMSHQFSRLQSVSTNLAEADPYRSATFEAYWECFRKSPIFGKGIGYVGVAPVDKEYQEFVTIQLIGGGHGAYMSMLALFGAIGASFFVVFLFGGLFIAYKLLLDKQKRAFLDHIDGADNFLVFSFLYLVVVSVRYTVGYAGYDDTSLFFLVGMIGGVKHREAMDISV